MPCKNCKCEMTCKEFERCVLEPIPEDYDVEYVLAAFDAVDKALEVELNS